MGGALVVAFLGGVACVALAGVEIGGVVYDHVDPGPPFSPAKAAQETWQPAKPTRAERHAGMIAYYRPAPELLRPWSRPKAEECVRGRIRVFAARGEIEPVWVALYALEDLHNIRARVEGLPDEVKAEIFVVHFWPQRTSWRSRTYYITPELLLPYNAEEGSVWTPAQYVLVEKPYEIPAGRTGALWVRFSVGRSAAPGTYSLRLRLQAAKKAALSVPISLEILPFMLSKPPDKFWLMYGDVRRWAKMSDEQRWLDAKDFASHGIDGIVEMPLGNFDLSGLKQGRVKIDIKQTRRYLELLRQAGMRGPWVMVGRVAGQVRRALGISADLNKPWPEAIRQGVQKCAAAAASAYKNLGIEWYFYGCDEPSEENIYAIEQYKNWHEGGAPIYVTINRPGFWTAMAEYIDAPCFSKWLIDNPVRWRGMMDSCRRLGKQMWWYGSGCYIGQEGRMFPNRFLAGYLFWKTQARCQVSWTYTRPHEDPFNDFDGVKANRVEPKEQATIYPWWEKPGDWSSYRGPIQTIQWEALREGIDDYCYLYTLSSEAERAASAPGREQSRGGRKAKRALRDIVSALPWSSQIRDVGFDNALCHSLRWLVAQQIELLETGALMKPGSRYAERPIDIRLRVRPAGRALSQSLPVVCVPRLSKAPVIDGLLEENVWQEAAQVTIARDTRTGEVVSPPAQAWLGYDDKALYIAFRCEEPLMKQIVMEHSGRDAEGIWQDDSVEVFIDPSGERRRYAHIIINAAGAMLDEIGTSEKWDSSASVGVKRYDKEWKCELAIPWSDLKGAGFKIGEAMAINLCRNRYADSKASWRHAAWSATYGWFHVPERFGIGIRETGEIALLGLDVTPFVGTQTMGIVLANRSKKEQLVEVRTQVSYESGQGRSGSVLVSLPAHRRTSVKVPLELDRPGKAMITIAYGPRGGWTRTINFSVVVPQPATLPAKLIAVRSDGQLRADVELNVLPSQQLYTLAARLTAAGQSQWRGEVECAGGQSATLEGKARVPWMLGWMDLTLERGGKKVWHERVPIVPVYEALRD